MRKHVLKLEQSVRYKTFCFRFRLSALEVVRIYILDKYHCFRSYKLSHLSMPQDPRLSPSQIRNLEKAQGPEITKSKPRTE